MGLGRATRALHTTRSGRSATHRVRAAVLATCASAGNVMRAQAAPLSRVTLASWAMRSAQPALLARAVLLIATPTAKCVAAKRARSVTTTELECFLHRRRRLHAFRRFLAMHGYVRAMLPAI